MELWGARQKKWPGQHAVPAVFAFMMWMFHRCIEKELLDFENSTTVGFVAVFMDLWGLVIFAQPITVWAWRHCNITATFCVGVELGVYTDFLYMERYCRSVNAGIQDSILVWFTE